ncbi:hypothetical protein [Candidatus Nitrososphaera evergladensis]|nr:hypothetical protein [Candidatus Nitrososphaera evergladensis]
MMRTYLDSGLVTPEQANQVLKRLQEKTREYCSQQQQQRHLGNTTGL